MSLDPVILSRIQFTWVVAWHILLPAFTLGAASVNDTFTFNQYLVGRITQVFLFV